MLKSIQGSVSFNNGTSTTVTPITFLGTEYQSGQDNPSWYLQVANGVNATTPYTASFTSYAESGGAGSSKKTTSPYTRYTLSGSTASQVAVSVGHGTSSPVHQADADAKALGKFLTDVRDQMAPFKGLVFLGELRDTLRMIAKPARGLWDGLHQYAQAAGRLQRQKVAITTIADLWLEYAFGWKPLFADISDAAKVLRRKADMTDYARVFGAGSVESSKTWSSQSTYYGTFPIRWRAERRVVEYSGVRYVGAISRRRAISASSSSVSRLASELGFSLTEFIPSVWELLPWSFIIDYFSNVGDVIGAHCTNTNALAWYCRSRKASSTGTVVAVPADSNPTGYSRTSGYGGTSTKEVVRYIRDVPLLGTPPVVVSLPGLGTKWINMAALAASLTSGGSSPLRSRG